ncbi:MAG TPA: phenylalanine--tRNA ligase subunit alpha [Acidimicrobiales bacterium]|nr:phenylalanine--tRNA ligase subunit alpha [Acidimicrobiales bacterium]
MDDVKTIREEGLARLSAARSSDELASAFSEVLGKKSAFQQARQGLRELDIEARRELGRLLQEVEAELSALADKRASEFSSADRAARLEAERLDLTEVLPGPPTRGSLSLVTQTRDELEDVFVGMGFTVAEGPEVETDWHNFEALNIPKAHPARSGFDSLYLDWGEPESTLFRPHTSPVQIRLMQSQPPPIYAVMPGKVYRKDTPDASHNATFHQIEGLVVDHGITFGDLAGTIDEFIHAYFGPQIQTRLRPASFPFTEPSAEFEVTCAVCGGEGCRTCSGVGWIELGGCGMVHPNVFRAVGINPEEWTGFAFGFGIDRIAIVRHGLEDIRVLLDNDVRFISQF